MTTVTIQLQEIKDYVPPQAPGFGKTVVDTFTGSVGLLQNFGQGLVLTVVAATPWLPFLAVLVLVGWLTFRRRRITPAKAHEQPS